MHDTSLNPSHVSPLVIVAADVLATRVKSLLDREKVLRHDEDWALRAESLIELRKSLDAYFEVRAENTVKAAQPALDEPAPATLRDGAQ